MDVLFDARMLNRALSGLERVQFNVLRELAAMPEITRLRVILLHGTETAKPLPESIERVEVWSTDDIIEILLDPKRRPDVYHLSWFPDTTPRDVWLPLIAPASVVEVHDAILNRHPEYFPNEARCRWYNAFTSQLCRNADRLLVHSNSVKTEIENDMDCDASNADLAPLAVDPDLHGKLADDEVGRRCHRIGFDGKFILAVGKDYPHKDHATLLRALARLDDDVRLCIAGTKIWHRRGETSDEIIAELGLESRVQWVQGLDDADIKALIQGCAAMAFPSLEEGFGLPPIEAMTLGTPVVAANAMSIPEICGDGAWLHAPGDDIELEQLLRRVLAGGSDVEVLVERGYRQAAKFSWRRTAEFTAESYRRAIAMAGDGSSPRPRVAPEVLANLAAISQFGHHDTERELQSWQARCLGAEGQLRRAHDHTAILEAMLLELEQEPPTPPVAGPLAEIFAPERQPRWSLRRRLRKMKDGLRSRFS